MYCIVIQYLYRLYSIQYVICYRTYIIECYIILAVSLVLRNMPYSLIYFIHGNLNLLVPNPYLVFAIFYDLCAVTAFISLVIFLSCQGCYAFHHVSNLLCPFGVTSTVSYIVLLPVLAVLTSEKNIYFVSVF